MTERSRYNATFLIDKPKPESFILLKRSPLKSYAPNFCTGIGGGIGDVPGLENETVLESAYRELSEETNGQLNRANIEVTELARLIYDTGITIYYFWGIYSNVVLPQIDPKDGELVRVNIEKLFDFKFIPSAGAVCKEWSRRGFSTNKPFTMYVKELGVEDTVRLIEITKIKEGLVD